MPNQRGENQTRLVFALDKELLEALDKARPPGVTRSEWLRAAMVNELARVGCPVDPALINAPDRAGKGGRPRKDSGVALVREEVTEYKTKKKPKS